ncbi:hypothetical protein ARMGADRAFT_1033561 [Armillaria gallica]|uniref:Uncharacterized protein n=1 Tax=Armillaria gallica TaxID=47427 RepID=A0A2H3D0Z6_ARMGA|nr:hypothetical protein ARMGADRAFT_1033561 [Armillaria gallica]
MKLKSYLHFDENHPKAAYIKDMLINKQVQKGTPSDKVMANTFLQDWEVNTRHNSQLPKHVTDMLQTMKNFNTRLNMLTLSKEVQSQIPLWHYHSFKAKKQKRYGMEQRDWIQWHTEIRKIATAKPAMMIGLKKDAGTHTNVQR